MLEYTFWNKFAYNRPYIYRL